MRPEDITPLDIINAAITRLQRTGWQQYAAGFETGPNCLSGAIRWGTKDLVGVGWSNDISGWAFRAYVQARTMVITAIREQEPTRCRSGGFGTWNDVPERTYEDVMLLLKEVRTDLETAGGSE